jgi:prevent-host-death family protein
MPETYTLALGFLHAMEVCGRATLCYMRIVTHREMRNQSGDILRRVADGETIQVTNNGQVAALIVPPGTDPLADLFSRGQVRVARNPTSSLRSIVRRKSTADSQAIVADVRGRW